LEYEFTELEQLVSARLDPTYLRLEEVTDELLQQYTGTCYHETEKIKKRFYSAGDKGRKMKTG
jgi:hypothetical protein